MKSMFLLFLLSASLLFAGCGSSKDVTFKEMTNVKLKSLERNGTLKITADAVLNNPRRAGAKVTYLECAISVNGEQLAEIAQMKEAKVPRRSDFSVPLETSISLKKVIGNTLSMMKSVVGEGKVDIRMKGTVKVKVFGKTFTVPFDFEEETPISIYNSTEPPVL